MENNEVQSIKVELINEEIDVSLDIDNAMNLSILLGALFQSIVETAGVEGLLAIEIPLNAIRKMPHDK